MIVEILRKAVLYYNYFIAAYLVVYITYLSVSSIYGSVKMYQYRKREQLHNVLEHEFYFPISILVPFYNEGVVAVQTVKNLLLQDYRKFEIIMIDDGSKDDTKEQLLKHFPLKKDEDRPIRYSVPCKPIREIYTGEYNGISLVLISKENGGCKADAINAGINIAKYPYFVNMDGDEILQKDALKYASRAILEEDNVIAVGGNLKMSNSTVFSDAMPVSTRMGKNLLVDVQVLEYGRGFIGTRIFQNRLGMNLIISGGYGVFNKAAVIEVGGYDTKSMGEDMELTLRLHHHFRKNKKKYIMQFVPDSVCWTQGPESLKDLTKQRERWHCGLIQTIGKYRSMILNPRYGLIGMWMLPYIVMYEMLSPVFMILGWGAILWTIIDKTINFPYVLYMYLVYLLYGVLLSVVSYVNKIYMKKDFFTVKDLIRSFFVAIVDALFFRVYLSFVTFFSFFKVKKIASKWVSPKRVQVQEEESQAK